VTLPTGIGDIWEVELDKGDENDEDEGDDGDDADDDGDDGDDVDDDGDDVDDDDDDDVFDEKGEDDDNDVFDEETNEDDNNGSVLVVGGICVVSEKAGDTIAGQLLCSRTGRVGDSIPNKSKTRFIRQPITKYSVVNSDSAPWEHYQNFPLNFQLPNLL